MPVSDRPGPPKVPLLCAACVGSLTCRPCTQRAHTIVEEWRGVLGQSRGRHSRHARLNTPPCRIQTPPFNPHANRETYSGHTFVHERAGIKRNTGRAPPVRPQFKRGQTPAKLLLSALYLHEARQTAGKNRTPLPLPHLLLHHFLHPSDGFR